ncbi:ABC transporter permease [Spiroplasma eriocheiris]|uniref:ABC-2 type transporter transmembrane domain-containing protein n=1 Tax=Spiroplasma eriocheiris TaxID=315358 RepID=A0A0H3XJG2_9MOLU|nr:ABC transporter permease [Spiroplasma eriocheiris]AHF57525.1 putative transmembrane protein [Spiroplasma eriocheiris CCTCC M 207170]AKM53981.1 hypothetical protein SERIO_v1c04020 [Spiroplasma eriocheiris]
MKIIFKLIWKFQSKSWISGALIFIVPVIFLFISVETANTLNSGSSNGPYLALPGVILAISPLIGLINLGITISEIRNTTFYKHLKISTINLPILFGSLIIYNLFVTIIGTLWIMLVGFSVYHSYLHAFKWINWPLFSLAIIISTILACSLGLLLGIVINNFKWSIIIALVIFLLSIFLSGLYLPLIILKNNLFLTIISYCLPFTYPMGILLVSWYYSPPVIPVTGQPLVKASDYSIFSNLTIPLIISLVLIGIILLVILGWWYFKYFHFSKGAY